MEFIDKPNFERTKYKVRRFVEDLKQVPNQWAVYRRYPKSVGRQSTTNCFSAVCRYRLRYPEITWEAAQDDNDWYVAAIYESTNSAA